MKKMNLKLALALLTFCASTQVFAAKFQNIPKLKSSSAQKLAEAVIEINKNEAIFGDAGRVVSVSFTRSASESDIKTIKQLNFAKGGLNSDDSGAKEFDEFSTAELVNHMLEYNSQTESEHKKEFAAARESLRQAFDSIKNSSSLKIYGTNHADEDGSWQILSILDTKNSQILFVRMGYYGT